MINPSISTKFPSQVVFIDSGVSDYQALAAGVVSEIQVVILDSRQDGIQQITEVLSQKPYSTVHLVSHGSPGCLYLGNNQLSLDTLDNYASDLKTWFSSPTPQLPNSPTLLLYGCNVAAGNAGEEFIAKLNTFTRAEIAASTTPIGNAELGGNWELDAANHKVNNLAFTKAIQKEYSNVFATATVTPNPDDPNPDETIPEPSDNPSSIIRTFDVTDDLLITDVNFGLSIDHTRRGHLDVTLQDPDGNIVDLITDQGNDSDNLYVLFDDSASTSIANNINDVNHTTAGYTNTLQPEQALSAFNGKSSFGIWTLTVLDDNDNGANGEYNDAQLIIEGDPSNSVISGSVYLDADTDGTDDGFHENGLKGIVVTATDASGNTLSTTTAIDGTYTIDSSVGSPSSLSGEVRLEFTLPSDGSLDYLSPTSAGGVDVHFVDIDTNPTVDIGFSEPDTYAVDSNLRYAVACYVSGNPLHVDNLGDTAVATFLYSDRSQDNEPVDRGASYVSGTKVEDVGTIWGLANDSDTGNVYIASVLKRHSGLGPNGIGAIYLDTDMTSNDSTNVSLFYDFGSSAGSDIPDNDTRFPGGTTSDTSQGDPTYGSIDADVYSLAGERGLGGIDLAEDGSELYAINLNDRKLYSINTSGTATATEIPNAPWLNESTANIVPNNNTDGSESGVARPWAVKVFRDKVYVGVVTDGSTSDQTTTGANNHLTAHVFAYDGTSWESVLASPIVLDYQRDAWNSASGQNYWHPWNNNYSTIDSTISDQVDYKYAQPILGDIEFTNDGSMTLSLLDRSTFQFGYQNADPLDTNPQATSENIFSHGDILRVQNNDGTYNLENNGAVTDSETGSTLQGVNTTTNTGIGGREFYDDSWGYQSGSTPNDTSDTGHAGVAINPTAAEVLHGSSDTFNFYGSGVVALSTQDGSFQSGIQVFTDDELASGGTPAKAGGLGDIELLNSINAPLEIGDRIWNDTDADGIQDPGEAGIANVTLRLFQGGSEIGTATTDSNGQYLFGGASNTNLNPNESIQPNTSYEIRIDPASASLSGLNLTVANQESNDSIDSDAVNVNGTPTISVTTGDWGENNFTLDSGFTADQLAVVSIGSTVFGDSNNNGTQDSGETGISSVAVELYSPGNDGVIGGGDDILIDSTTTDGSGNYIFDGLAEGDYYVSIPATNFGSSGALENTPISSTTTETTDNRVDGDDNGTQTSIGAATNSPVINLSAGNEPVDGDGSGTNDEFEQGNTQDNSTTDANGDMTVDFGFVQLPSLGNKVFFDNNQDGIQNGSELGVEGVTITLVGGGDNGVIGDGDDTILTTTTDANGEYSFSNLTPGIEYQVTFEPGTIPTGASFTTADAGGDDAADSDANVSTGVTPIVTLTPGENNDSIDAGVIKNVVTGTATATGSPEALTGSGNSDLIIGGKGEDTLTGGGGADCFYFNETSDGIDTITDFAVGTDKIDISAILSTEFIATNGSAYSGSDPITDNYLKLVELDHPTLGKSTIVQIDFDASGTLYPKDIAFLQGVHSDLNDPDLSLSDFII